MAGSTGRLTSVGTNGPGGRTARVREHVEITAIELFDRDGYESVTVRDIARAAGVAERTVYRHFPAKQALVLGDSAAEFDRFVAELDAAPPDLPPTAAFLHAARSRMPGAARNPIEVARIRLLESTPELRTAWSEALERWEPALAAVLSRRRGLPAPDAATLLAAALLVRAHRHLTVTWTGAGTFERHYRDGLALLATGIDTCPARRPG
ncbi:TetR/AcrR family transcriptional regulator [Pseudonocardia sp. NPDC049635]|uniref:TetR/AcrR family transcriptional regulator n=1 Tax=Pseudonocardia sp. NPDC049635 TaxID=3155506 RepID=UPI003406CE8F